MKAKTKGKLKSPQKAKPALQEMAPPKKKKRSFLKILATTIGILGIATALLSKKEKVRGKKSKVKPKVGAA